MTTLTDAEKKFNEYIKKFCAKHEISEEEANKNLIVQEYKAWVIKECGNDNRRKEAVSKTIQTCGC